MDEKKFSEIAQNGLSMLRAAMSGIGEGDTIAYNAYWRGQEVVCVGYQFDDEEGTVTKPLAILIDPEIFEELTVDEESGRVDGEGNNGPALVR